jgi:large subunit ribosomal protein L4
MEATVYSIEGKDTGRKVNLADSVFGIENPSEHAIVQDVKHILANKRQGTHKSKERGEVSGSTRKPYRQKGTGNARAGHKRSPLWRHGGTVFGPRPRDYVFKLNRKLRTLARKSALTLKNREEGVRVIEKFSFDAPKTKSFLSMLSNLEVAGQKVLVVTDAYDKVVYLSGRNLRKANVMSASDLNTYDILHADHVLIMEPAVEIINERLA